MSKGKKVARRKGHAINAGTIVFILIFIYLLFRIFMYFNSEHLAIYEVREGQNTDNNNCVGVILREEEIITTEDSGYINYYLNDGSRVGKNDYMYTIDETGELYKLLAKSEAEISISSEDNAKIKDIILNYKKNYNDSGYYNVYDFKYDLENIVLELSNVDLAENINDLIQSVATASAFEIIKSEKSGIISYSIDGMESLTESNVSKSAFNIDNYVKKRVKTENFVSSGSAICKLVTSDDWSIIFNLTKEQYYKLLEKTSVKFTILKDELTITAPIKVYQKEDSYFGKVNLQKYMVRYINERYLEVEISLSSSKGLKIPSSSVVTKDFYLIPKEYFTTEELTENNGLLVKNYDDTTDGDTKFIQADIYYTDDEEFCYIDPDIISIGQIIVNPINKTNYQVSKINSLEGVYNVNNGYAIFKRIEKIYEDNDYCIISNNTYNGINIYDRIIVNGKTAKEHAIIY